MYWPLMRSVLREMAVGWQVMTDNEFDALAVFSAEDGDLLFEMAKKIDDSMETLTQEQFDAWHPFAVAVRQKSKLLQLADQTTDPESKAELLRRMEELDVSAFFPDALAHPEMEGSLPGLLVTDDGTGAKLED